MLLILQFTWSEKVHAIISIFLKKFADGCLVASNTVNSGEGSMQPHNLISDSSPPVTRMRSSVLCAVGCSPLAKANCSQQLEETSFLSVFSPDASSRKISEAENLAKKATLTKDTFFCNNVNTC